MEVVPKGFFFCQKWHWKEEGCGPRGEASLYETLLSYHHTFHSPPGLSPARGQITPKFTSNCQTIKLTSNDQEKTLIDSHKDMHDQTQIIIEKRT